MQTTYGHLLISKEEGSLFVLFLVIADSLARQSEEIVPHGQKKPLLSMSDLWVPPRELLEVPPSKRIDIVMPALPADQEAILKVRQAPSRIGIDRLLGIALHRLGSRLVNLVRGPLAWTVSD